MSKQTVATCKIKAFFGNMSIGKKIGSAMVSLLCLFSFVLTIYHYTVSSTMIRINSERQIISTLNQAINNLDNNFKNVENLLYDTSTNAYLQDLLLAAEKNAEEDNSPFWEISVALRNLLTITGAKAPEIRGFYAFDAHNREYAVKDLRYDFDTQTLDWELLNAAKGANVWMKPQYGSVLFGTAEEPHVIPVGKTVYSLTTHKALGHIVVYVDTKYFLSIIDGISFSDDDTIFLMDGQGNTITDEIPAQAKRLHFQVDKLTPATYNDQQKRIALWPTESNVYDLYVITQDDAQNQEMIRLKETTFSLLFWIGVLIISLGILISRSISKPILNLVEDMKKFSKGDLTIQSSVLYHDEIGVLRRNFNQLVNSIRHLVNDVYREKMLKQQAQLRMLQMQINPHFLYNTLDTIHWLAQSYGANDVSEVSHSLGYLMRFSLTEQELIPLEEEIDAIEHYMLIQKYRYGAELEIKIVIEEHALYEKIPKHIILPLIENAVEHGFKNKVGKKRIQIESYLKNDIVIIIVSDNGSGMPPKKIKEALRGTDVELELELEQEQGQHVPIGLRNVNRRIKLRYGDEYALQIDSSLGKGTKVLLRLPCQEVDFPYELDDTINIE